MASVVGLGIVGQAAMQSFELKNIYPLHGYDKYKDGGLGCLEKCLQCPLMLLCLPTPYDHTLKTYNKQAIHETLCKLSDRNYKGIIVIKSTVEPGTTMKYSQEFPTLSLCHSPEFLSAKTAFTDFHNQRHVVIGRGVNCSDAQINQLYCFFHINYPEADISICSCTEAESMKCFVNTFYAVKVQYFNELYMLCQNMDVNYTNVRDLMLKNKWINPMHTSVPGHDGKLSYGGACLPKDTTALLEHMKRVGTPHDIIEGCVRERNRLRDKSDDTHCKIISNGVGTFSAIENLKIGTNDIPFERTYI